VINALIWLKDNNILYKHVNINHNWVESSLMMDIESDLTCSLMRQHDITVRPETTLANIVLHSDNASGQINVADSLALKARHHGFEVYDVPGDGDCS
jgi:hypothetical protein